MTRRAWLAFLMVLAVMGGMASPAVADDDDKNSWRAAISALAGTHDDRTAQAYERDAVQALAGVDDTRTKTLVAAVAKDADSAFRDGAHFVDRGAGLASAAHNAALLEWLEEHVSGRGSPQDQARVKAIIALLRAGRVVATVAVQDLDATIRSARAIGSTFGDTAAARRALGRASARLGVSNGQLKAADGALKGRHILAATTKWSLAWGGALTGLTDLGIDPAGTGDADHDGLSDALEFGMGASPYATDTDGDGLTDRFEIDALFGYSLPGKADTDGDGLPDGREDLDGEGLTALQEQAAGSSPTEPDTDNDGLDDARELQLVTKVNEPDTDGDGLLDGTEPGGHFDPLKRDTDGDGVIDSDEVATAPVTGVDGITATLTGKGELASTFSVSKVVGNEQAAGAVGQVGPAYDFAVNTATAQLQQAELTIPYDPDSLGTSSAADLRLFYLDPVAGSWTPVTGDQAVDPVKHTVTATVTHFSTYAIFDIANWNQTWSAQDNPCQGRSGGGGDVVLLDLALVLDSSGSMIDNDPTGLRLTGAKTFVDALLPDDRAAVIDFDFAATVRQGLTSDKAAVKAAIDLVDSAGGTDIGAGVGAGVNVLQTNGDPARARMMIMLTDGVGSYDPTLTDQAKAAGITIYTIGLGTGVDDALLQAIADGTGGKYNKVATAADLPEVFRRISDGTGGGGDLTKDTDGDGLTDCQETQGVLSGTQHVYTSDPTKPDTDGDGLSDSEEIGPSLVGPFKPGLAVYSVFSDPRKPDSDGDTVGDAAEADEGTLAFARDTDGDGLNDADEIDLSTDPTDTDTDGDNFTDGYEDAHRVDQGLNPLVLDVKVSKWSYAAEFAKGALAGDLWRSDSLAWLAGNLASGASSFIPVFGWIVGGIADLRDAIGSAIHADWVGSGLSAVGVLPYAGDAIAIPGKAAKFVLRNVDKSDEVLAFIAKLADVPHDIKISAFRQILGADFDVLIKAGASETALVKLATGGSDLRTLAAVAKRAKAGTSPKFFTAWRDGEKHLQSLFPGSTPQKWFSTKEFKGKGRFVDVFDTAGVMHESKVGFVKNSKRIRDQIDKDAWIVQNKIGGATDAVWHFFPSGRSNSLGADKAILDLLDANKIPYVLHMPS